MVYAGIDVGSMSAEAVLIEGDRILASKVIVVKPNPVVSATLVMEAVLEEAGLGKKLIPLSVDPQIVGALGAAVLARECYAKLNAPKQAARA